MVFVGNAAIDRTYFRALGLRMETLAFGAFVRDNVVVIKADGFLCLVRFGSHP